MFLAAAAVLSGCAKKEAIAMAGVAPKEEGASQKSGNGGGERKGGGGRGGRGGGGGAGQRQPVEVTAIVRRDLSQVLPVVGSLAANEFATIRPEMNGLIRSIHFEEGQRVKKGDLLVKIEDSELQAQVAQGQARHQLAQLNLTRADNLRQTQSNTQADVDRARSEFSAADADVALLKVRLARTEVRAPFDGVVEGRTLSPGDYVNTQAILTTISDLKRIKVEFQVPEGYVSKVKKGTTFTVKSTSGDAAPAQGEIYFVNSVIDRNTRSSEVKGYLTSSTAGFKPGMFAVIEMVLEVRQGALAVPEGAILIDPRGPHVITVVEEKGEKVAAFVPVTLGLRSKGLVEIKPVKGEFAEKQLIVAAGVGSLALFPGSKLELRPLRAEFQLEPAP
ncbi:MAG: efflux RND transporter periplasmic adaptor subunit [Opitutaceae bacterium]